MMERFSGTFVKAETLSGNLFKENQGRFFFLGSSRKKKLLFLKLWYWSRHLFLFWLHKWTPLANGVQLKILGQFQRFFMIGPVYPSFLTCLHFRARMLHALGLPRVLLCL